MQIGLNEQYMLNQLEIGKTVAKSQIEVEKAVWKQHLLNQEKIDFEQKKIRLQEYRKEMQKAKYEEVYFIAQGEIEVRTKNLLVDAPKRRLSNFQFKNIFRLKSTDGNDNFYLLELFANMKNIQVFLNGEKVGKPDYLMKKITEVGGEIYANKRRERENILIALWTKMCSLCEKTIIIPSHIGWIRDGNKGYKFIEKEDLLWEDIVKKAK